MGGKKFHSKAEEAKARKEMGKATSAATSAQDASWDDACEGMSKSKAKKQDKEAERSEAAKKKAEAKQLAQQEADAMASYGKKQSKAKSDVAKVTAAQRAVKREEEAKAFNEILDQKAKQQRRELHEEDYGRLVDAENRNREDGLLEATGIDAAVSAMEAASISPSESDAHPERRRKAAYAAFEDRMMRELRSEQPGLKLSQYKEMIFKMWKKASDNPMNQ